MQSHHHIFLPILAYVIVFRHVLRLRNIGEGNDTVIPVIITIPVETDTVQDESNSSTFKLADGTNWKFNHNEGKWHQV